MERTLIQRMREQPKQVLIEEIRSKLDEQRQRYFDFVTRGLTDEDKVFLFSAIAFYDKPERALIKILGLLPRTGDWASNFNAEVFYQRQKQEYQARTRDRLSHELAYLEDALCFEHPWIQSGIKHKTPRNREEGEAGFANVVRAYEG